MARTNRFPSSIASPEIGSKFYTLKKNSRPFFITCALNIKNTSSTREGDKVPGKCRLR